MGPVDLVDASRRGIETGNDRPELSYHGWAMSQLDNQGRDWDTSAVHASDYSVILSPENQKCERQLWHRFQEDDRADDSLWKQVMFDQGESMQARFSYYIHFGLPDPWEVYGIEVECNGYLPHENDVGSCDLVLWNPEENHFYVIEIKTQRGNGIQRIKSNDEPKESHKLQNQSYLYALYRRFSDEYEDPTIDGSVFYLDREGQNPTLEFPIERDDDRIEQASQLANEIKRQVDPPEIMKLGIKVSRNKTTDDSIYLNVPWQCQYCDYRGISCEGAIVQDKEYTKKLGELSDDGDVIITADVDDTDYYKREVERVLDSGNVTKK